MAYTQYLIINSLLSLGHLQMKDNKIYGHTALFVNSNGLRMTKKLKQINTISKKT